MLFVNRSMTNHGLTVRAWNDAAIARRDADGYANATAMCQANGKHLPHYISNQRTKDYIDALATSLGLTPADLVITTTTGPNEFRGTWIHPRLAVDLARWISPEFAVWMDGWFLEQLEQPPAQAPGLTAEDVARIAIEAARTVQGTVQTVQARPRPRSARRQPRRIRFHDNIKPPTDSLQHLQLMQRIHELAERLGRIGWRDFHHYSSRLVRETVHPDQWLAAIRDLESIGAGAVEFGARNGTYYSATTGFPISIW